MISEFLFLSPIRLVHVRKSRLTKFIWGFSAFPAVATNKIVIIRTNAKWSCLDMNFQRYYALELLFVLKRLEKMEICIVLV